MRSILFSWGPLHIYSYGVMIASGILISVHLMTRRLKTDPLCDPPILYDLVFVTAAGGFGGARLYYVFQNAGWYFQHPLKIFAVWEGGLIFYGGVVGSVLGLWIFCARHRLLILEVLDFLIPYVALSQAFGRIGCFLNGCCYGKYCPYPWAVSFPQGPAHVHPAQLYEFVYDLILFAVLVSRDRRKQKSGVIFGGYLVLYGFGRFWIEFFRDGNPMALSLTWNQWISLGIFLMGCGFLCILFPREKGGRARSW